MSLGHTYSSDITPIMATVSRALGMVTRCLALWSWWRHVNSVLNVFTLWLGRRRCTSAPPAPGWGRCWRCGTSGAWSRRTSQIGSRKCGPSPCPGDWGRWTYQECPDIWCHLLIEGVSVDKPRCRADDHEEVTGGDGRQDRVGRGQHPGSEKDIC